jgi:hypothetical protein
MPGSSVLDICDSIELVESYRRGASSVCFLSAHKPTGCCAALEIRGEAVRQIPSTRAEHGPYCGERSLAGGTLALALTGCDRRYRTLYPN